MSTERIMAQGRLRELEIETTQKRVAIEEARRSIREATAIYVAPEDIDSARIVFGAAQLVKAVEDYRRIASEIAGIRKDYGL